MAIHAKFRTQNIKFKGRKQIKDNMGEPSEATRLLHVNVVWWRYQFGWIVNRKWCRCQNEAHYRLGVDIAASHLQGCTISELKGGFWNIQNKEFRKDGHVGSHRLWGASSCFHNPDQIKMTMWGPQPGRSALVTCRGRQKHTPKQKPLMILVKVVILSLSLVSPTNSCRALCILCLDKTRYEEPMETVFR